MNKTELVAAMAEQADMTKKDLIAGNGEKLRNAQIEPKTP